MEWISIQMNSRTNPNQTILLMTCVQKMLFPRQSYQWLRGLKMYEYRICPIKRAVRGGNDRVCVYLLIKNATCFSHQRIQVYWLKINCLTGPKVMSHSFSTETTGMLRMEVKQGSSFDPACFHMCFATFVR